MKSIPTLRWKLTCAVARMLPQRWQRVILSAFGACMVGIGACIVGISASARALVFRSLQTARFALGQAKVGRYDGQASVPHRALTFPLLRTVAVKVRRPLF